MPRLRRFLRDRPTLPAVGVALGSLVLTWSAVGSRPEAREASRGAVSIELRKTVGTDPASCAATGSVTVLPGRTVVYCYEIENTGGQTVTSHDLVDDQLGTLLSALSRTVAPGASFSVTETAQIQETTVNTATWTASGPGGSDADVAEATVIIAEPSIELTKTVGQAPSQCAATGAVTVASNAEVTYCYEARNTGNVTLKLHDLVDDQLGTLLDDLAHDLDPGEVLRVQMSTQIAATTVNSATWTARDPFFAMANDSATVTVDDTPIFVDGFESGDVSAW